MAFKIQDLMTDVQPDTAIRWATCPGTSCGGYGFAASNTGKAGGENPQCKPASCGTSPKPNPVPKPGGYPSDQYTDMDLALLQQQLQRTLEGARV